MVTGLKHDPQLGPRLSLASSYERIRYAITFLSTESLPQAMGSGDGRGGVWQRSNRHVRIQPDGGTVLWLR